MNSDPIRTYDKRLDEGLLDPEFRIYGLSISDILEIIRFMDCYMLKVKDLRNLEVRKYRDERKFILDDMLKGNHPNDQL